VATPFDLQEHFMRMSTKGRFAVNAMIDLALRERAGPVSLAAIAARQQISLSYLEQLFSRLRRNSLVQSTRGPGGGYTLGRDTTAISVADIIIAVEDGSDVDADARAEASTRGEKSAPSSPKLWASLQEVMLRHMATISLRSLVDEQLVAGVTIEDKPVRRPVAPVPMQKTLRTTAPNSVFAFGQSFGQSFGR
jgi:Rrf2 family transcriptional regulator, iron-sulfur cluster assembly transcription factor